MSALTLQMFGVPVAGKSLLPTNVEASGDFAATMVGIDESVVAVKECGQDQVLPPDPTLLVAPHMILVGHMPGPGLPKEQAVIETGPQMGASARPVAEAPAVLPRLPPAAGFDPQPHDVPPAAVSVHKAMIQKADLSLDALRSQERSGSRGQVAEHGLPDMGVPTNAPPKPRESVPADLSAAPVFKQALDLPTHQRMESRPQPQEPRDPPALATTAETGLPKATVPPGGNLALGATGGDLPQRDPDVRMREPAPATEIAPALLPLSFSAPDRPFGIDGISAMLEGDISLGGADLSTPTDSSGEPLPEEAHPQVARPIGPEEASRRGHPVASSSAESAWQMRLRVPNLPAPVPQGLQSAVSQAPPRATVDQARDPALSWAAEATQVVKTNADPIDVHAIGRDVKADSFVWSGAVVSGPLNRAEQGDVAKPVFFSPVLVQRLAAQNVPPGQRAETGAVEVLLNPEELGSVRFHIQHHGESVRVMLCVERPETLELVRRHAEQLMQEFRQAGFSGATLSFGSWAQQDGQPEMPPQPSQTPQPEDSAFVAPAAARPSARSAAQYGGHGLNLRL